MNLAVSRHAIDEAVKDFRIPRQTAEEWIRSTFRKARFVANIVSGDGKPTRLYGFQRIAIALAADEDKVVTVYPQHANNSLTTISRKVDAMVTRELRVIERRERILERKITLAKAELDIEKAELNLRILRARSSATRLACQARINAINEYYTQMDADLLAVKHEKRAVAKTVVAYI